MTSSVTVSSTGRRTRHFQARCQRNKSVDLTPGWRAVAEPRALNSGIVVRVCSQSLLWCLLGLSMIFLFSLLLDFLTTSLSQFPLQSFSPLSSPFYPRSHSSRSRLFSIACLSSVAFYQLSRPSVVSTASHPSPSIHPPAQLQFCSAIVHTVSVQTHLSQ